MVRAIRALKPVVPFDYCIGEVLERQPREPTFNFADYVAQILARVVSQLGVRALGHDLDRPAHKEVSVR
jgi:hypothetical protein